MEYVTAEEAKSSINPIGVLLTMLELKRLSLKRDLNSRVYSVTFLFFPSRDAEIKKERSSILPLLFKISVNLLTL